MSRRRSPVRQELENGLAHGLGRPGRHDDAGVRHCLGDPTHSGRHRRKPARHGLDERVGEAFGDARQHAHLGVAVGVGADAHAAFEGDDAVEAELRDEGVELVPVALVAGRRAAVQAQPGVLPGGVDHGERADERRQVLDGVDAAQPRHDRLGRLGDPGGELVGVDPVVDGLQAGGGGAVAGLPPLVPVAARGDDRGLGVSSGVREPVESHEQRLGGPAHRAPSQLEVPLPEVDAVLGQQEPGAVAAPGHHAHQGGQPVRAGVVDGGGPGVDGERAQQVVEHVRHLDEVGGPQAGQRCPRAGRRLAVERVEQLGHAHVVGQLVRPEPGQAVEEAAKPDHVVVRGGQEAGEALGRR
jgi:hypothetical protein